MKSPPWKVYRDGEYIAACHYAEDAAAVIAVCGIGTVKWDHAKIVWREGEEEIPAIESYDRAAEIMRDRAAAYRRARDAKADAEFEELRTRKTAIDAGSFPRNDTI